MSALQHNCGPSSDAIRALLTEQIEIGRQSLGYVAAVTGFGGARLITCGRSDAKNGRALDGDTVFEVYPEGGARLFNRIVDAQITFERDPDGSVPALVLHQNGRDRRGMRLP